jgi:hypothetical protein
MILGAPTTWNWWNFTHGVSYPLAQCVLTTSTGKNYRFYNGLVKDDGDTTVYSFPSSGTATASSLFCTPCAVNDWIYLVRAEFSVWTAFLGWDLQYRSVLHGYRPIDGATYSQVIYDTGKFYHFGTPTGGRTFLGEGHVSGDPVSGYGVLTSDVYTDFGSAELRHRAIGRFTLGTTSTNPSGYSTTGLLDNSTWFVGGTGNNQGAGAYNNVGIVSVNVSGGNKIYKIASLSSPTLTEIESNGFYARPVGPCLYVSSASGITIRQEVGTSRSWSLSGILGNTKQLAYLGEDATYYYVVGFTLASGVPKVVALTKTTNTATLVGSWVGGSVVTWAESTGSPLYKVNGTHYAPGLRWPISPYSWVPFAVDNFTQLKLPIMEVT